MEDNSSLIFYLTVWLIGAGAVIIAQLRKDSPGAGLSLAYILNLWINHWVASTLYAIPGYSYFDRDEVVAGLEQSTYAVAAFAVGYLLLTRRLTRAAVVHDSSAAAGRTSRTPGEAAGDAVTRAALARQIPAGQHNFPDGWAQISDSRLTTLYIVIGGISYLLFITVLGNLPTVTAIIASASNLALVGMMLKSWRAWHMGNRKSFLLWLIAASVYPMLTIITQGFLGFGVVSTLMAYTFVAKFYRPRWKLVVLALAAIYIGLSVYVSYMRDRNEIRSSVWGGESYESRMDQLKSTFSQTEFFSINNYEHLERVDSRLNFNAMVGASLRYIESNHMELAKGETLWQALLAFIPRVIWPDKPVSAGSSDLVSRYTGYTFAEGTSVGVGPVMEFYINFGQGGVIVGFLIMGFIIALIDRGAGACLAKNDSLNFICWYLPGIAFLQVGGSFVEVTAGAGASLAVATLIKYFASRRSKGEGAKSVHSHLKFGHHSGR